MNSQATDWEKIFVVWGVWLLIPVQVMILWIMGSSPCIGLRADSAQSLLGILTPSLSAPHRCSCVCMHAPSPSLSLSLTRYT